MVVFFFFFIFLFYFNFFNSYTKLLHLVLLDSGGALRSLYHLSTDPCSSQLGSGQSHGM